MIKFKNVFFLKLWTRKTKPSLPLCSRHVSQRAKGESLVFVKKEISSPLFYMIWLSDWRNKNLRATWKKFPQEVRLLEICRRPSYQCKVVCLYIWTVNMQELAVTLIILEKTRHAHTLSCHAICCVDRMRGLIK